MRPLFILLFLSLSVEARTNAPTRTVATRSATVHAAHNGARCPEGAFTCVDLSISNADLNTLTGAGDVWMKGAGSYALSGDVTIAANRTFRSGGGAVTIVTSGTGSVILGGNNSALRGFTFDGNDIDSIFVSGNGYSGVEVTDNAFTAGSIMQVRQSDPATTSALISRNTFNNAQIYARTLESSTISYNTFTNCAAQRPIEVKYGKSNIVEYNTIDSGITGIIFLPDHATPGATKANESNIIRYNTISGVSEEAISFDLAGTVLTATAIREYDTVASKSGGNQVSLSATPGGSWTGSTAYNTGTYYLGFVTGSNAGKYYRITAHSSAAFTLSGITANEYNAISASDQIWVGIPAINNTITNNTITTPNTVSADGIVLWGLAYGNTISNNTVTGSGASARAAIGLWALDGMVTGGVLGSNSNGRAPVDRNTITGNTYTSTLTFGDQTQDYGGVSGMYSITGNTYSSNTAQ